MRNLLLCQFKVEFVNVVEGHLMSVSPKNDQFLSNHHRTVSVPGARLFPYHDVGVVLERLHELRDRLLPEISQFFFRDLHLWVWVPNHV
jgi:hypothetical protein